MILHGYDWDGNKLFAVENVGGQLSWSGDGTMIASWWSGSVPVETRTIYPNPLAIVNVETQDVVVFSFDTTCRNPRAQYPIFSPAGKFVAFNILYEDETRNRVILIDIQEKKAFTLLEDFYVQGWIASE